MCIRDSCEEKPTNGSLVSVTGARPTAASTSSNKAKKPAVTIVAKQIRFLTESLCGTGRDSLHWVWIEGTALVGHRMDDRQSEKTRPHASCHTPGGYRTEEQKVEGIVFEMCPCDRTLR